MTAAQVPPVGPTPNVSILLLGALMWSEPHAADEVLAQVADADMPTTATELVLVAVRRLVAAGTPPGPELVHDDIVRVGELSSDVAKAIRDATTSGAAPNALRQYAAAVVAQALRRYVESAGNALVTAADEAPEHALAQTVLAASTRCLNCAKRLRVLRGEVA